MNTLRYRCIDGITANEEHCRAMVLNIIGLITALGPWIGYDLSGKLAKEALMNNESINSMVLEKGILTREKPDQILLPENMIKPVKPRVV